MTEKRPDASHVPPIPGWSGTSLGYTQGFAEGEAHGRHMGLEEALALMRKSGQSWGRCVAALTKASSEAYDGWLRYLKSQLTGD